MSTTTIPGILILKGNKTYGRLLSKDNQANLLEGQMQRTNLKDNKTNLKEGKLLYKVIPNDKTLPNCLIPYEIKQLGFSKVLDNLYVLISNENKLIETIGPVSSNEAFYEYQLHCHGLKQSSTVFKNKIMKSLKNYKDDGPIEEINRLYNLEQRIDLSWYIFSIDPQGSTDFDDAFSIKKLDNENLLLSIYIANVPIWLDWLSNVNPDINLLDELNKISTIYLPYTKHPMLPNILSDDLCSLWAKKKRIAFTLDLEIDKDYNIIKTSFCNTLISVRKNWTYDDPYLVLNEHYIKLLNCVNKMNKKEIINDSHKLVEYLMIEINCICGKILFDNKKQAIYREAKDLIQATDLNSIELNKILRKIKACYTKQITEFPIFHDMLEKESYIHITSPIRRLVDILNMISMQKLFGLTTFSDKINDFFNRWFQDEQIIHINEISKKIKSVQNKCNLLHLITNNYIPETILEGYVIDETTFYIPEYKLQCKIRKSDTIEYKLYSKYKCKLYLFEESDSLNRKIRVDIII
jgi:exoribonuclease R